MIGDLGLEPAAIALGDAVPERGAEFVGPTMQRLRSSKRSAIRSRAARWLKARFVQYSTWLPNNRYMQSEMRFGSLLA
jgi:hypothetical protein